MSKADDADAEPSPGKPEDLALIHGVTPEGEVRILRKRKDRLEAGALRALKEGVPIAGEVVRLTPRPSFPLLCDVETLLASPTEPAPSKDGLARKGPPKVSSDRYRDNWDRVWGPSRPDPALSN